MLWMSVEGGQAGKRRATEVTSGTIRPRLTAPSSQLGRVFKLM